eukprot:7680504-Alexandrium_andersonii.AAC.1
MAMRMRSSMDVFDCLAVQRLRTCSHPCIRMRILCASLAHLTTDGYRPLIQAIWTRESEES